MPGDCSIATEPTEEHGNIKEINKKVQGEKQTRRVMFSGL
jgi:hypothetical protein